MHRFILTFATLAAASFFAGDASACHHKKAACAPAPVAACAPAPVVECAPAPVVAECAPAPKKCCFKMPKFHMPKMGCHKKAAVCAPAPVCETYAPAPVYAAPQASPQVMPTAQASMQG